MGSSQSISGPLVVLNTIVAESLDYVTTELEKHTKGDPKKLAAAAQDIIGEIYKEHKAIIFNGDGYSEAWHKEAAKRGLPNLRNTVDALAELPNKENLDLFDTYNVLSPRETHSRYEIYLERYCKDVNTESLVALEVAKQQVLPASYRYQGELAQTASAIKNASKKVDTTSLDAITELIGELEAAIAKLEKAIAHKSEGDVLHHAKHYRDEVIPAMLSVRKSSDALESIIADDIWPLPKYSEMLFIK